MREAGLRRYSKPPSDGEEVGQSGPGKKKTGRNNGLADGAPALLVRGEHSGLPLKP